VLAVLIALAGFGCEGSPSTPAGGPTPRDASVDVSPEDAGPVPRPSRCGADDQAPLRDADGAITCVAVGARFEARGGEWPEEGDGGAPSGATLYVRAGADPAVADGTRARPFAEVAVALGALPGSGGVVVVARGRYVVAATLAARGVVTILGAGPSAEGGTLLEATAAPVLRATGASSDLTVRDVVLRHGATTGGAPGPSILVEAGAALRAANVSILRPTVGVQVAGGARFSAEGLSVREAIEHGVLVMEGSACNLRDVLIRDGRGRGVEARESHLQVHRALIHENAGIGVALRGNSAPGPSGGAARCTPDGPSVEPGPLSCLSHASITCNGIAAVFAQGQVRAAGSRLVLSGTRSVAATPGGDGLVVRGGAAFDLDPDVATMGRGSEVVGNARVGILVQDPNSTLSMRGALVGSNAGAGLFIGSLATVSRVLASEFAFNTGVGVAVATSTELMEFRGSTIRDTRMGVLPGGAVMVGDGLSAGGGALGVVADNEFSRNPRFAGVFAATSGTLSRNRGNGNRFTLYAYDSPGLAIDATNRVDGLAGAGRPSVTTDP
jgi:hypothetical protein